MAAFIANDLKSTTLEDAFLELAVMVSNAEKTPAKNPDAADNIQVSISGAGLLNVSFSAPTTQTLNATGQLVTSVAEYLS